MSWSAKGAPENQNTDENTVGSAGSRCISQDKEAGDMIWHLENWNRSAVAHGYQKAAC